MKNKIKTITAFFMFITGIVVLLFPFVKQTNYQKQVDIGYSEYINKYQPGNKEFKDNELYKEMVKYNKQIYQEKQKNFNLESCEKEGINLKKYNADVLGYVIVPSLNIRLPIYSGANEANMKKGATHLSETSMPIGGNNTNTVICAHRRWVPAKMFNDLPNIKIGDTVNILNQWYTMEYKVVKTEKILANETEKMKIQDNKDMLTLFTCCYYGKRKDRFVVYCERISE